MNLGENIGNAFQVVKKTYENIEIGRASCRERV